MADPEVTKETTEQTLLEAVIDLSSKIVVLEQKMNAIPQDRHNLEHDWLKLDMERKQAQIEFWIDIRKKLATTTIIGSFGLLISALGYAITQWVKNTN